MKISELRSDRGAKKTTNERDREVRRTKDSREPCREMRSKSRKKERSKPRNKDKKPLEGKRKSKSKIIPT